MTRLNDFLGFLMEGLKVAVYTLTNIEFSIDQSVFSLLDLSTYSVVISATLRFISTRYHGSWRGDHKEINRKVDKK